jgi:hypothetical protein
MPFTKNIITDYGAVGNGVANDRPAFVAWKAAAQGLDAVLTIPAGTYYFGPRSGGGGDVNEDYPFSGMTSLQVNPGNPLAVTFTDNGTANDFQLSVRQAFYQNNTHSTRLLADVNAGATSFTVSNPSMFTVGRWALISGYDMQGQWNVPGGLPPNEHFFEYVKVSGISSSTITIDTALRNAYLTRWPNFNSGSGSEIDAGGPATLYAIDPVWDCEIDITGLTVTKTGATRKPTICAARSVILRGCTFSNQDGTFPTSSRTWQAISGCNFTGCTMESDKFVEAVTMTDSTFTTINFQSSSIDLLTMTNCTVGTLFGTPKRAVISNSTITTLLSGPNNYGRADSLTLTGNAISTLTLGGSLYKGTGDAGIDVDSTMAGGVIKIPNTNASRAVTTDGAYAIKWAVPGTNVCWQDLDRVAMSMFRVIDVTQDANWVYVKTDQTGGFPTYSTHLWLRTHPCPNYTGSGNSGATTALNSTGPLYSNLQYTCTGTARAQGGDYCWGDLRSLTIAVNTPYSGATNPLIFNPLGSFCWTTKHSDGSLVNWVPGVDAHVTGTRTITWNGSGYTVAGAKPNDVNLTPPDSSGTWIANLVNGYFATDIAGGGSYASIVVTIQTDQGIYYRVNPALAMRLRLHG